MTWVVDASVAVKWLVPEVLSDKADLLLARGEELLAPDLLPVEVANALWKKTVRREVSVTEAGRALDLLLSGELALHESGPLLDRALVLAHRLRHPVYDCLCLALAERARVPMITADDRLVARLKQRRRRGLRVVSLATL